MMTKHLYCRTCYGDSGGTLRIDCPTCGRPKDAPCTCGHGVEAHESSTRETCDQCACPGYVAKWGEITTMRIPAPPGWRFHPGCFDHQLGEQMTSGRLVAYRVVDDGEAIELDVDTDDPGHGFRIGELP